MSLKPDEAAPFVSRSILAIASSDSDGVLGPLSDLGPLEDWGGISHLSVLVTAMAVRDFEKTAGKRESPKIRRTARAVASWASDVVALDAGIIEMAYYGALDHRLSASQGPPSFLSMHRFALVAYLTRSWPRDDVKRLVSDVAQRYSDLHNAD